MKIMRSTIKHCLLVGVSLVYLIDAAQNIPQEQVSDSVKSAVPQGTFGSPLPQQPNQQPASMAIQQPQAPALAGGVQSGAMTATAPLQPATTVPVAAPAGAPVKTETVKPAVSTTQSSVPVVSAPTVVPNQPVAQPLPSAPAPQKAVPQIKTEEKVAVTQSEVKESSAVTQSPAQELPSAPALVPETKVDTTVQPSKKQDVVAPGEGIDTLEQEGGNWLLKRQALEKTIDVIEKIKDVFTKILETRVDYLVKRNKTDRAFDTFANSIGFELGDLNQLLARLVKQLKSERVKDGDLTEEERAVLQEIEDKIAQLKSLKKTVNEITEMDASLDEALMQLEKEITTSNSYQTRAWRNFQTIKKVLSDEKAEELYLQTESLLKNMQEILKYLNGDLLNYFDSLISTLKKNMSDTQEKIQSLAAKGINLQDEVKKIKKAEKLARKSKQQKNSEEQKKQEKSVEVKTPQKVIKKEEGWFDYIAVVWRYPLAIVGSIWDYGMSFFVTKKPVVRPVVVTGATEAAKKASENKKIETEKNQTSLQEKLMKK